jgi:hypothetical protein
MVGVDSATDMDEKECGPIEGSVCFKSYERPMCSGTLTNGLDFRRVGLPLPLSVATRDNYSPAPQARGLFSPPADAVVQAHSPRL